ncbi:MAG: hypothetical protein IKT60_00545 [Clostridia bacterium]|nr:hypothetical protein [Clostridia bacterium]
MPTTDDITRAIFSSPQSGAILRNMENIINAINSTEGRRLLRHLGNSGSDALRCAAAASADAPNAAKTLISGLVSNPDGSALISELFAVIGRK